MSDPIDPPTNAGPTRLPDRIHSVFRAIVVAAVPGAHTLEERGWREVGDVLERALGARPRALRWQTTLFLSALDLVALLRWGRRMRSLETAKARRLLSALEKSPVLPVRKGVWGVRTLAFMGYYGRATVAHDLGYGATAGGWSALGHGEGSWAARAGAAGPEPHVAEMLKRASTDA